MPFVVESDWFSGTSEITTYDINELLGTKIRALYQRKKGRDLFDLYYADQFANLSMDQITECYKRYINFSVDKAPTRKQFLINLKTKQNDPHFAGDLEGLLRPGIEYNQDKAFEWIYKQLNEFM